MRKNLLLAVLAFLMLACTKKNTTTNEIDIVPQPVQMKRGTGLFTLSSGTSINFNSTDKELGRLAAEISDHVVNATGYPLEMNSSKAPSTITLIVEPGSDEGDEGYKLSVKKKKITIKANTYAGLYYGIVTLKQMLPDNFAAKDSYKGEEITIRNCEIKDAPRFPYRGMMLDVSRHFQPADSVKEFIDILAYHKINRFHWHLTDGTGWRIEIDKYPLLTEKGAWRKLRQDGMQWVEIQLNEPGDTTNRHGGFYTKDEIREVIAYAASKFITIIPEIEMPGHSDAAVFCYPEYTCDKAPVGSGIYCTGKEETFEYLQNILDEVIELFPGEYIHIGADEVDKAQWHNCKLCQQRMHDHGLADEEELQSYFVKRMEKYISSKGKRLLGWDEILQGGIAEGATVMSWTGFEGGKRAAEAGHDAIMCPMSHVYFDYYQGNNSYEPQGFPDSNFLTESYEFEPVPEGLSPELHKHILGGQANIFTENIASFRHVEYMLLPRLAALSETLWTPAKKKNWADFAARLDFMFDRYAARGWTYAPSSMSPEVTGQEFKDGTLEIVLTTELGIYPIHYTLDGSEPTASSPIFKKAVIINTPCDLRARTIRHGEPVGYPRELPNLLNLATMKNVTYNKPYSESYTAGGDTALVDNRYADKHGKDPHWQGFEKENMDLIIDLGSEKSISEVTMRFMQHIGSGRVMIPLSVEVSTSVDGNNFTSFLVDGKKSTPIKGSRHSDGFIETVKLEGKETNARYVRIIAVNMGTLPSWHPGAGANAWIFTDEISVR